MLYLRITAIAVLTLLTSLQVQALAPCKVDGKLIYTRECLQRQNAQVTDELHQHQLQAVGVSQAPTSNAPVAQQPAPATAESHATTQSSASGASAATSPSPATSHITTTSSAAADTATTQRFPSAPVDPGATTATAEQPRTDTAAITAAQPQPVVPPSHAEEPTTTAAPTPTGLPAPSVTDLPSSRQTKRLPLPLAPPIRAEDCAASQLFRAVEHDHLRLLQQCQSPQLLQTLSNSAGRTLLHQAAAFGSLQSLEYLLAQHAKLEARARGDKGATPLHLAAEHNQVPSLRALVQAGANLDARDYLKRTPLHRANAERAPDSVAALIELGADLNSLDRAQQTPLLVASQQLQSAPLLSQLIDAGATLNHRNYRDMTALHYAVVTDTASTRVLVERKIDLNRMDNEGRTAILLAASEGIDTHWERIKLLVEAGANLNYKDKSGNTLLKLAYNNQHEEFLKLLLRHGVDSRNVVRVIEKYNKQATPD